MLVLEALVCVTSSEEVEGVASCGVQAVATKRAVKAHKKRVFRVIFNISVSARRYNARQN